MGGVLVSLASGLGLAPGFAPARLRPPDRTAARPPRAQISSCRLRSPKARLAPRRQSVPLDGRARQVQVGRRSSAITKRPKRRAKLPEVKLGAERLRFHLMALILLVPVAGCATRDPATRAAEQAQIESEEDATCREKGAPASAAYAACRKGLDEARAQQSAVREQKRRDFDRVLGAGTDAQGGL